MPYFRIKGTMVNVRGTKLPEPCRAIIKLADGRKEYCAVPSAYLCDWPAGGGRDCDFPMCDEHRMNVGPNKDYCPEHAADAERAQPGLFTRLTPMNDESPESARHIYLRVDRVKGFDDWQIEAILQDVHPGFHAQVCEAQEAAQGVPQGFWLAPDDLTPQMTDAALAEHDGSLAPEEELAAMYEALRAAAPPAPQQTAAQPDENALLRLLTDLRWALGDFGNRMQSELVEYAKELKAKADKFDAQESAAPQLPQAPQPAARVGLTDERIDAIAHAQDEPGEPPWFTAQLTKQEWRYFARAIESEIAKQPAAPIDMVLHCAACGMQHVDKDERPPHARIGLPSSAIEAIDWRARPHRSHLCHGCGHIWRPADVPTNGVAVVKTQGKDDSPIVAKQPAEAVLYGVRDTTTGAYLLDVTNTRQAAEAKARYYGPTYETVPLALAQPAEAVRPTGWQITLGADEAGTLRDAIGDDEPQAIVLSIGGGHSGYGLYAWSEDYPEEGAVLVRELPQPVAGIQLAQGEKDGTA